MKARIPGMGGGIGNIQKLVQQAQEVQDKMEIAKKQLDDKEYNATSGGGAVCVTVKGSMEIKNIEIKPEVVNQDDIEMLSDLIIAAVNEALRAAVVDQEETIEKVSGGLKFPGM